MSPAPPPRPPRRDEPEHPAERGLTPGGPRGPARPGAPPPRGAAPRGQQPPPPPAAPNPVARAGKFFEVRKGRAGKSDEEEDEGAPEEIALPRSITQEQEEADLKRRLNREELVEIDKRHAAVKLGGVASEPSPIKRRGSGVWLLVLVILAVGALFALDHFKIVQFGTPVAPQGQNGK